MTSNQTKIVRIYSDQDGSVFVHIELADIGSAVPPSLHITSLSYGCDMTAHLSAVNQHLVQMNKEPISDADVDRVEKFCATTWVK